MPFVGFANLGRSFTMAAALLTLSACAEPFVYQTPSAAAPTVTGTAVMPPAQAVPASGGAAPSGTDASACPSLDFKLAFANGGTIAGSAVGSDGHFDASGELYENGTLVVQLWKPTYWPTGPKTAPGAKPFAVWRGTVADGEVHLYEQPPAACRRSLTTQAGDLDVAAVTRQPQ